MILAAVVSAVRLWWYSDGSGSHSYTPRMYEHMAKSH